MPSLFRILVRIALLHLGMLASSAAVAEDEGNAPAPAFTQTQALQDLAAIVECRAPASVVKPLSRHLWEVALGEQTAAPFDAWRVVEQPNASLREVELPAPITVFGHQASRIAVLSEAVMAIIDGVSLEDVSQQLQMKPLSATMAPHIHTRKLSLRNVSDDGFHVRSLTASRIASHPGAVLIGCEERYDSRSEQLHRRGKDLAVTFAPGVDLATELDEVLSCKADSLRSFTAGVAVAVGLHSDDERFKGWQSGENEEGDRWWALPAPISIAGVETSRLLRVGTTLYAELEGSVAEELAGMWGLTPYDGFDEATFVGYYDTRTADDGWLEDRVRVVREWLPGRTLQGCQYTHNYPEFGEHPDDENEE